MAVKNVPSPEELSKIKHSPPFFKGWMNTPAEIKPGTFCYAAQPKNLETLGLPNPRVWKPLDADWKLPDNWKAIVIEGIRERISRYRSFHIFMDICVRCGACADKCHFFIGSGDPKNMPVLRAELLGRSTAGNLPRPARSLGKWSGPGT